MTYQTQGSQSKKLTILSGAFDYLTGVDLPASEGVWRSESIVYRREQGPVCLAINAESPSSDGFISVAVIDLSARKAQ